MTLFDGPFAELEQILAQAEEEGSTPDDPFSGFSSFLTGEEPAEEDEEDEEDEFEPTFGTTRPQGPPKLSTVDPFGFQQVRQVVEDEFGVSSTVAGAFVNDQAAQWFDRTKQLPEPWQLLNDAQFMTKAQRSLITGADLLPEAFIMEGTFMVNTPSRGILPVPGVDPELAFLERAQPMLGSLGLSRDFLGAKLGVPRLSAEQVLSTLSLSLQKPSPSTRRRPDPIFDRATVAESVRNLWRFLLKEEPENLDQTVNEYVRDATAFARKGGSLGIDAWLRGRIRSTDRYKTLYARKPEHVDEDQWLSSFEQIARQTGVRESSVLAQTERGATAGQEFTGFGQAVSRTPEARALSAGGFSRQLAQTVAGVGILGRT